MGGGATSVFHEKCSVLAFDKVFAGTREFWASTDPFHVFHPMNILGHGITWYVAASGTWCPILPFLLCPPN